MVFRDTSHLRVVSCVPWSVLNPWIAWYVLILTQGESISIAMYSATHQRAASNMLADGVDRE